MLALVYLLAGLALIALATAALAGPWWGVLVLGIELVALAVLEARGGVDATKPKATR